MLALWGARASTEDGGVVGDWCARCGAAHAFRLTHHYAGRHVLAQPVGERRYATTTRHCVQCGAEEVCDPRQYARVLSHAEALGKSVPDLIAATNPRLIEVLRQREAYEAEAARRTQEGTAASGPDAPGPRVLDALKTLEALDTRREDVAAFLAPLRRWDYLPPNEREVLLREIAAFAARETAMREVMAFLQALPPADLRGFRLACAGAVPVVLVSGFGYCPFVLSWGWGTFFVAATLCAGLVAYRIGANRRTRRWVNDVLVPRARVAGVDFDLMVELLARVNPRAVGMDRNLARVAGDRDTIRAELRKRCLLAPPRPPLPLDAARG